MKKHSLLKVVLFTLAIIIVCTWILPTSTFSGQLTKGDISAVSLVALLNYPMDVLRYFGYLVVFLLAVGGLYGILYKIPAYKALLETIAKGFKGKEFVFIIVTSILLAVLASVTGLNLGFLVVFPMLISIILMLGYNKLVAITTTVGSVIVGLLGTTFGSSAVSNINNLLSADVYSNLLFKIIIFVLALALLLINLFIYATKTKNDNKEKSDLIPETIKVPKSKKVSFVPLVIIFDLMFLVMLLSVTSWVEVFKVNIFADATKWFNEFKLFKYPLFTNVIGQVQAFGEWSLFSELPVLVFVTACILALVYRIGFDEFIDGLSNGFKKVCKPIILTVIIYLFLIISTYHPFQLTIYNGILGVFKNANIITVTIVTFLSGLFNVEALYSAQSVLPYVMSITTNESLTSVLGLIYQSVYGLSMLVLPSSVLLITTLSYTDVSYGQWLKHILFVFLEILAIVIAVVFIAFIVA